MPNGNGGGATASSGLLRVGELRLYDLRAALALIEQPLDVLGRTGDAIVVGRPTGKALEQGRKHDKLPLVPFCQRVGEELPLVEPHRLDEALPLGGEFEADAPRIGL